MLSIAVSVVLGSFGWFLRWVCDENHPSLERSDFERRFGLWEVWENEMGCAIRSTCGVSETTLEDEDLQGDHEDFTVPRDKDDPEEEEGRIEWKCFTARLK
jgi:hypothetical protein